MSAPHFKLVPNFEDGSPVRWALFKRAEVQQPDAAAPVFAIFAQDCRWMLIHQLDAFLLENQINTFCELGYDYHDATWSSGFPNN